MTELEKRTYIRDYCLERACKDCIFNHPEDDAPLEWCDNYAPLTIPTEQVDDIVRVIQREKGEIVLPEFEEIPMLDLDDVEIEEVVHDPVHHPKHYCRDGGMECIDEMILLFGKQAVKYFCLCNAWKYRYRAADKNGEQDIAKSDWYIKKYKELNDSGWQ